jgi:hypothetical protein
MTSTTKPLLDEQLAPIPLLQEAPLRELLAAGMVGRVVAKGLSGGFVLEIHIGDRAVRMANTRGGERLFASLETVALLLRRMGMNHFEVDVTHYEAGRIRAAQPERSAAMKAGRLPKAASKVQA